MSMEHQWLYLPEIRQEHNLCIVTVYLQKFELYTYSVRLENFNPNKHHSLCKSPQANMRKRLNPASSKCHLLLKFLFGIHVRSFTFALETGYMNISKP